jgi:hypothetical protein
MHSLSQPSLDDDGQADLFGHLADGRLLGRLAALLSKSARLYSASCDRMNGAFQRLVRRVNAHRGAVAELEGSSVVGGEGLEPPASSV